MKAYGYIRVSTDAQAESGISLDHQRARVLEAIAARGWDAELVVDTTSAKNMHRPGLQGALSRLEQAGEGALVVSRLDRLSRSVVDFYAIVAKASSEGWTLVCLDPELDMSTAGGRAMAGMIAVFAQYERELISQRQRESIAQRKAAGTYRTRDPAVSDLARDRIISLRRRGLSAEKICTQLTTEGLEPPMGAVWHPRTVRRIIDRHLRR